MLVRVQKAAPRRRKQSAQMKAAQVIMDRNEARFSRAFKKAMRALYASSQMKALRDAIRAGGTDIDRILATMSWYDESDPDSVAFWSRLVQDVSRAYEVIIEESGQDSADRYKLPMKFKVTKAEVAVDIVVPVNTHSIRWVRQKSASLVKDISSGQQKKLRALLARNFERGVRPEAIIDEIEAVVGLTETQAGWVAARQDLAIARGVPAAQARAASKDFAARLLTNRAQTIARTETVDAHTKGLTDVWRVANDGGFMRPGTKKVWESMEDERVSDICEELNGQEVLVNEPFFSSIVGSIDRPPAHPNCRSTMSLKFP